MQRFNWINIAPEGTTASNDKVVSLHSNNVNANKKRPIYVQLQKTGNGFKIANPHFTSSLSSGVRQCKIQKLTVNSSQTVSSPSMQFDHEAPLKSGKKFNAILQGEATKPARNLFTAAKPFNSILPINEHYHPKTTIDPRQNRPKLFGQIKFSSMSQESNNTSSIANNSINLTVNSISTSASCSEKKQTKRQYKKRQPTKSSTEPKYNFPPPPKKMDFKVNTTTQFATVIDNDPAKQKDSDIIESSAEAPLACTQNKLLSSAAFQDIVYVMEENENNLCDQIEAAEMDLDQPTMPSNITTLKKLVINTYKHNLPATNAQELVVSPEVPEETELALIDQAETTAPVVDRNVSELPEVLKRLDRIEALQLAAIKRDSEMMVVIKKMYLANKRFVKQVDGDFDEIKALLPISSLEQLNEVDQRIRDDPDFAKIMKAYLRGFKDMNNIDDFTSIFRKLIKDSVVEKFNLKGKCGKYSLEQYKIVNIIHEIHMPMDAFTFEKIMRNTIEKAKNRYHNCGYRNRKNITNSNNSN